ncbi:hypothetical protein LC612_41110, partial [Nostoc sp. CHAB 5834]|nr:hypothetical protein [Nostoc sp. CHAB 5834]
MNKPLNFTVPIDFVVQHARDMVLSANWRGALNCLMNGVSGMTYDVAVRVLSGQSDFEAGEDVFKEVFEISSESKNNARMKYLELSRWQTCGCYHAPSGEIFQPYGIVEHFGQQDLDYATEQVQQLDDVVTISEFRDLRVRFFMKHRESDVPFFSERHGVVLFRRVQGPAFWVPLHTKIDEALDAYLELRNLDVLSERPRRGQSTVTPWQPDFYREAVLAGHIGYVDLRDSLLRDFDAEALMAECSPASSQDREAQPNLVPVGNRFFISAPQLSAAEQLEKEAWLRELRAQVF